MANVMKLTKGIKPFRFLTGAISQEEPERFNSCFRAKVNDVSN